MISSKLRNKFNKSQTCVNFQNDSKQRNKSTKVLRKANQQYFHNWHSKSTTDTKRSWKALKPLVSYKSKTADTFILHENSRIIKDKEISHILDKYFTNLTKTLKLRKTYTLTEKSLKNSKTLKKPCYQKN